MNNPFRNLVKKPAKHEKGGIVVADSGNVKEVAKIMIGFEALLRETQSYMSKACGNKLFDSAIPTVANGSYAVTMPSAVSSYSEAVPSM